MYEDIGHRFIKILFTSTPNDSIFRIIDYVQSQEKGKFSEQNTGHDLEGQGEGVEAAGGQRI